MTYNSVVQSKSHLQYKFNKWTRKPSW